MRILIKTYLVTIIGVVSGMAGLFGFNMTLVPKLVSEAQLAVSFIGFFALFFFIAHITTRARWERRSRYSDAFRKLNLGFEEIHDLSRAGETTKEQVIQNFNILCDSVADVFSTITGVKCSVCIKIFRTAEEGALEFETLCRDRNVQKERLAADIQSKENKISHTLSENTALSEAAHNRKGYFMSNRLPWLDGYKNTSFEIYGKPYIGLNPYNRWYNWPLPYKSAIVVPILPAKRNNNTHQQLLGFLCVDSDKMGLFDKKFDPDILMGVADGIYNTLKRFKDTV